MVPSAPDWMASESLSCLATHRPMPWAASSFPGWEVPGERVVHARSVVVHRTDDPVVRGPQGELGQAVTVPQGVGDHLADGDQELLGAPAGQVLGLDRPSQGVTPANPQVGAPPSISSRIAASYLAMAAAGRTYQSAASM